MSAGMKKVVKVEREKKSFHCVSGLIDPIHRERERETDRQTDRQTDTDTETETETDRALTGSRPACIHGEEGAGNRTERDKKGAEEKACVRNNNNNNNNSNNNNNND